MSTPVANGTQDAAQATPINGEAKAAPGISNLTVKPEHRRQKLIRKLAPPSPMKYKLWLGGHICSLVFGGISFLFQIFFLPNRFYINSVSYRLAFLGAIVSLTATMSHKFGLKYLPPSSTLVAQQNFQYLVLAFVWIFTFKSNFKIIPYFLISLLQVSANKNIDVVLKQSSFLASIIAYDELFLIVYLLLRTILFRNTSGYQLGLFIIFYWLRILYNKATGNLFHAIVERLDGKVSSNVKNKKFQHAWERTKEFLDAKQHGE